MAVIPQILEQSRPANNTPVSLYSPAEGEEVVAFLFISNSSGAAASARVFLDDDGAVMSEVTQLIWDVPVRSGLPPLKVGPICMNNSDGNLSIRTSAGNALTFTLIGIVKT